MNGTVNDDTQKTCVFCNSAIADYMIESPQTGLLVCNRCAETIAEVVENMNLAEADELEEILEDMEDDMWFDWDDEDEPEECTALDAGQDAIERKELLPRDIVDHLDKSIIGQERAKKAIATAIYQHERRVALGEAAKFQKNNILLFGPSGCGKTMIAKKTAELLDVPFVSADATAMTATGYVGENVEHMLARLLVAAGYDVKKAERGVIFIDEIDKLAKKGNAGSCRDVGGEEVQNALLKLLEGSEVTVEYVANGIKQETTINTKNILFICAGAFAGLTAQEKKRKKMGFCSSDEGGIQSESLVTQLADYGMIPELLGRIPVVAELKCLNENDIVRIMKESEASILKEYEAMFDMEGIQLVVEDDAIREIARIAEERQIGARGLRAVFEEMMQEIMFALPEARGKLQSCIITKNTVYSGVPELIAI